MTQALCLCCGNIKFGAICPCPECGVLTTGEMDIDILFSDHWMNRRTLEEFGNVIKTIDSVSPGQGLTTVAFFVYLAQHYPRLCRIRRHKWMKPARELLSGLELPPVEVLPGRNGLPPGAKKRTDPATTEEHRWWQFWKRGP